MKSNYLLNGVYDTPWAILPNQLVVILEVVHRHIEGEKLEPEEVQQRIHGARRPADRRQGSIAVLPLFGTIFPRANLMTDVSGATSAERFGAQFSELASNSDVSAIVLDVDSPGGQVGGIDELSKRIYDARGQKPIVAVANHIMASAAYWIGTAADEVVVSPSAEVGAIGIYAAHEQLPNTIDSTKGSVMTLISEGKYKLEGNPFEPLAEEARAAIHERVSDYYSAFVKAVARNRGASVSDVRGGFGEGRVVGAKQAVSLGMADRIATLEETIQRLQSSRARRAIGADTSTGLSTSLEMRRRRLRLASKSR